jgi:hypothetical protein
MARKGKLVPIATRDTEERAIKWRKYPYLILIVCEDEQTEPYYFSLFKEEFDRIYPRETVFLRAVGTGLSSKGVVEQAIVERDKLYNDSYKTVDEVWAVFDKDDADLSTGNTRRFDDAFSLADKERIQVAYSNEVFELWLLLHFTDVDATTPIPREKIYKALEDNINKGRTAETRFSYKHGESKVIDIVVHTGNERKAIERALLLEQSHEGKSPIASNPMTKVHLLVGKLREWISYYSS